MKICKDLLNVINSKEMPIKYIDKYREIGLMILDGGTSMLLINYCPFCGEELPKSLRNQWHKELKKLKIKDPYVEKLPSDYLSDKWWNRNSKKK